MSGFGVRETRGCLPRCTSQFRTLDCSRTFSCVPRFSCIVYDETLMCNDFRRDLRQFGVLEQQLEPDKVLLFRLPTVKASL